MGRKCKAKNVDAQAKDLLHQLGIQLDAGIYPRVKNGGIIVPNWSPRPQGIPGDMEKSNAEQQGREAEGQGRPRRAWQPWSPGQGQGQGPRTAGEASPLVSATVRAAYRPQVGDVAEHYPDARLWDAEHGVWILAESRLFQGLRRRAWFLIGMSYRHAVVRSWAFWVDAVVLPVWIGPRHTNYNDGSICAFEPSDGTWTFADGLVPLVDFYTLWAARHLHLEVFGRWPGAQAVHRPYERILEIQSNEKCGCRRAQRSYGECCRSQDLARDRISDAVEYVCWTRYDVRKPPEQVMRFVRQPQGSEALDALL